MASFSYTQDQEAAEKSIQSFLCNRNEQIHVLEGYSGTGKTFLVGELIEKIPSWIRLDKVLHPHALKLDFELMISATTNQAAEVLGQCMDYDVVTTYVALGLFVKKDYRTGNTKLTQRGGFTYPDNTLLLIDEASYVDGPLMGFINQFLLHDRRNKVLFIGDPKQLLNVGDIEARVFSAGWNTSKLCQVVRQAEDNAIIDASVMFREALETGQFGNLKIDNKAIIPLDGDAMKAKMLEVFGTPSEESSCVLAYRNKTVLAYNNFLTEKISGVSHFKVGDQARVNDYVPGPKPLSNGRVVRIQGVRSNVTHLGEHGHFYDLPNGYTYFCPTDYRSHARLLKQARAEEDWELVEQLSEEWIDLRAIFAMTVYKAQGSTFDNVFIDLSDLGTCKSFNQLARMLYVAFTRARHRVYLYGDI